jgi:hypothetical protein
MIHRDSLQKTGTPVLLDFAIRMAYLDEKGIFAKTSS